jgi:HK97 family phage major capsid protein
MPSVVAAEAAWIETNQTIRSVAHARCPKWTACFFVAQVAQREHAMPTATLNDQRLAKAKELQDFHKEHAADWTDEIESKWVRINGEYDELKGRQEAEIEAGKKAKAREDRLAAIDKHERTPISNPLIGRDGAATDPKSPPNAADWQRAQFMAMAGWMKAGTKNGPSQEEIEAATSLKTSLTSREFELRLPPTQHFAKMQGAGGYYHGTYHNTLTTGTGTSGGFLIGETFLAQLERAMLWFGSMLQSSEIIRTASGEPMHWPTANDTTNEGVIIPESTPVTTADPSFGRVNWGAFKFSSKEILVPYELLQDSLFNLEPILAEMLGERIGRHMNRKFTVGVGGIEPMGIVNAATLGKTAASATAITYLEMIDLEHSIDPSRRAAGCSYVFHDNILLALRKLVDSNGLPIWQPANVPLQSNMATGLVDRLNGYTYFINNHMASTIATGNKTVLFGQLRAYKIREVGAMRMIRLNELHAESDQVAFLAFARADGNLLDAGDHPVKYYQQA